MYGIPKNCIAVIGSVTQAMRARRALENAGVRAEVVKADSSGTRRGCAYAVSYPCAEERRVRTALQSAGIGVRRWGGGSR